MNLLQGLRVVTTALNLPGPAACARLRDLGATVAKIEPPAGDPFEQFCPSWYRRLHEGMTVGRLDLKSETGRRAMARLLDSADILVTAQRASALARLGLDAEALARAHPRLCHVAITGHAPPDDELPGHDLTYLAAHGLVAPPHLPPTLFADMAGAERAVSAALALVIGAAAPARAKRPRSRWPMRRRRSRSRCTKGSPAPARCWAAGSLAIISTRRATAGSRWPPSSRTSKRLAEKFALGKLTADALRDLFATHDAAYWEEWARRNDLPIVAVRTPSNDKA